MFIPFALATMILGGKLSISVLAKILYGRTYGIEGTFHLWFLPCFFISVIIFNLIVIGVKKEQYIVLAISLLAALGLLLNYNHCISLRVGSDIYYLTGYTCEVAQKKYYIGFPFSINIAFTGVALIYLGRLLKRLFVIINVQSSRKKQIVLMLVLLFIGMISFMYNQILLDNDFPYHIISMAHAIYGNYALFLLTSLALSGAVVCLSYIIDNKYTAKYGALTMGIYIFHPFVLSCVGLLGIPSFYGLIPSSMSVLFLCLTIPLIRKLDPFLIGDYK